MDLLSFIGPSTFVKVSLVVRWRVKYRIFLVRSLPTRLQEQARSKKRRPFSIRDATRAIGAGNNMAQPFLPLPTGLIGDVSSAKPLYGAGRPFYPFLSYEQLFIILAIFAVGVGLVFFFASEGLRTGIIVGGICGMVPPVLAAAPYELHVTTPRPIPWAEFTREYLAASRCELFARPANKEEVWTSTLSGWRAWRDAKFTIVMSDNSVYVKGTRGMVLPLSRNWKRIASQGPRLS